MSEIEELLERFRRGPELVAVATTGAAGAELDFRPAPNKWSVRQIVCHLADSEQAGAMRFRQMIAEDNPTLPQYNQDLWAEKLDYTRRKLSSALDSFRRTRAETFELLRELPAETFARTGTHAVRGSVTLLDMLRLYAGHAEKHSAQIRAARDAYRQSRTAQPA